MYSRDCRCPPSAPPFPACCRPDLLPSVERSPLPGAGGGLTRPPVTAESGTHSLTNIHDGKPPLKVKRIEKQEVKAYYEEALQREAASHCGEALRSLLGLMRTTESEMIRRLTALDILSYGVGKPATRIKASEIIEQKSELMKMSDKELEELLEQPEENSPDG